MKLRVELVLKPGSDVSVLKEALASEPRFLAHEVVPDLERTDGQHLGFGADAPSLVSLALETAAMVAPMIVALGVYDVLKNSIARVLVRNRAIAPTPISIADALAPEGAWLLDVFIAFGRTHRSNARDLRVLLQREGLSAFIDEDLVVGSEWALELPRLLAGAQIVVYLLGSDLDGLSYLKSEIAAGVKARETRNNKLLPFVISAPDEPLPMLPYGLDIIQASRWGPGREAEVAEIVLSVMNS